MRTDVVNETPTEETGSIPSEANNENALIEGIKKAIEDRKDAEMKRKVDEIIESGRKTIELIKAEEQKKTQRRLKI